MTEEKIQAITLSYTNYREYDRVLTLFSPQHGLVTATAHAVRRGKSQIRACADMFFFGEFVLKKNKKGYYSVKSIDIIDVFYDLRLDMNKLSCATYLCDFCRAVALSEHEQHQLFILLIKSLSLLCYDNVNYRNVKLKFEISAMEILGYGITLDRCSVCGDEVGEFSALVNDVGGVVCRKCNSERYGTAISLQGLATLRQLEKMPIENIGVIKISDKVYEGINESFKRYVYWHIEHTFKSIKFLENNYIFN